MDKDNFIIAGFDWSKSSPAGVYMELTPHFTIQGIWFRSVTKVKKLDFGNISVSKANVCYHYQQKDMLDDIFKAMVITDKIMPRMLEKVKYVAFEGYAFGAKGTVFDLAEACQTAKLRAYEHWRSKVRIYDIGVHKRAFSGHGNSDKVAMWDAYWRQYPNDILNLKKFNMPVPTKKEGVSPTSDIIDAFSICSLLRTELMVRAGMKDMKDLDDCVRQAFLYVSKSQPQNLLTTDFMWLDSNPVFKYF